MKLKSAPPAFFLVLLIAAPASADFVVTGVDARLDDRSLHVSARVELILSEQAELAIENGVPLVLLTEFELQDEGFLWKRTLLESRVRRQLRYRPPGGSGCPAGKPRLAQARPYPPDGAGLRLATPGLGPVLPPGYAVSAVL